MLQVWWDTGISYCCSIGFWANEHLQSVFPILADRVASYKQLRGGVEFVEEIPKSPSGKILRRVLRDREKAKMAASTKAKL